MLHAANKITGATGENVYNGYVPQDGDTSAYKDGLDGCLRMGGGSVTGTLTLTLSEAVKGVKINAHAWTAKSSFTDTISVNGSEASKMTLSYANYTFSLTSTNTVTITTTNRGLIQSIELFK